MLKVMTQKKFEIGLPMIETVLKIPGYSTRL